MQRANALHRVRDTRMVMPKPAAEADASPETASLETWSVGPRTAMRSMRSAGVKPERAPEEALEDFIASRAPPPEKRRRRRGNRTRGSAYHAWLLEDER